MYAIIATGGKQYTVNEGDVIRVEKLGVNAGDTVTFDQVLFVNDGTNAKVGEPTVAGATTLNITNAGENIAGGEMNTAGTTVGTFENVSAEVLVRVPCNSSVVITVKDNTATNPITVSQPSLTITRVA